MNWTKSLFLLSIVAQSFISIGQDCDSPLATVNCKIVADSPPSLTDFICELHLNETVLFLEKDIFYSNKLADFSIDSICTKNAKAYLVLIRFDHDRRKNRYWNDTIKKLIFLPPDEIFRDTIFIENLQEGENNFTFWVDYNHEGFEMPPKKNLATLFIGADLNYSHGFGVSPGIGVYFFPSDLFLLAGSINGEVIYNQTNWLAGYRLSAECHLTDLRGTYIPLGTRLSVARYTNFKNAAWKFTPEIGFSFISFMHLMVGYNFAISPDNFTTLDGWRFSIGIKHPFFIRKTRKDAKKNSNISDIINPPN